MTLLTIGAVNKDKKQKNFLQTIKVIIFLDFLIFYKIFLSSQMKLSVIISNNKDGTYQLRHKLPKELRFTILES